MSITIRIDKVTKYSENFNKNSLPKPLFQVWKFPVQMGL
jgi:hypothetical protein